MTVFTLSQLLVGIAICLNILAFQFKKRRTIILLLLVSCSLVAAHFMLLDYWTAASLLLLSMTRLTVGLFTVSKKWMVLFMLAAVVLAAMTYHGWLSVLSCSAVVLSTFASFSEKDRLMRLAFMVAACLWLVHDCFAGSPMAMGNDALFLISSLVGYYRFYVRKRRHLLD
jgi:hypothetical protein